MGLFNFLGGDSKSSTTNSTSDQKIGADNGGTANRVDTSGNVIIGSDAIAGAAIENSTNALAISTNFLDKQLTAFFDVLDHRAASADANVAASQQLAATAVNHATTTDSGSIIKVLSILAIGGVAVIGFKSGAIKL